MDMKKEVVRVKDGIQILFWLGFLSFFIYSFQTIMDFEGIANPHRQESVIRILTALSQPNFLEGEISHDVAVKMWETIQMGFLATTLSAIFAIPITFLSARPTSFWGSAFKILLQPMLSVIRAVHPLVLTMFTIVFAGFGPTAGVLALTLFSMAVLIGSFSEYAQQHNSLSWLMLFKVHFPGLALKHLPVNILTATILGFMGGGGIGVLLQQHTMLLNYRATSVALLACIITIGSIDLFGRAVWRKIQQNRESPPSNLEPAPLH
jgi:phosphonate transport system permease protein